MTYFHMIYFHHFSFKPSIIAGYDVRQSDMYLKIPNILYKYNRKILHLRPETSKYIPLTILKERNEQNYTYESVRK